MARVSRFEIDLELCLRMSEAARASAIGAGALVSIAIVDAGGHLLAFQRMDGAEIAGPVLARDKAFTAVAHRTATHDLTDLVRPGAELAGMNSADGGRYIAFGGGLPMWDANRVVGGVGVSGGTCEQDVTAASAALTVFSAALTP